MMLDDGDMKWLVRFAMVGLVITAPLWGPVAALGWLWDRVRGAA